MKLNSNVCPADVFTLLSIKTRIETRASISNDVSSSMFLLYYPLKQGLKLNIDIQFCAQNGVFTLLSIKTRIETSSFACSNSCGRCFYSTIH